MKTKLLAATLALAVANAFAQAPAQCSEPSPAAVKPATTAASPAKAAQPLLADPSEELKKASELFRERYPKTKVKSFSLTPVKGIFEAAVAKEVIYFDATARFLFSGRLLDMEKGVDLTEQRLKDIRRIDINKLPLENAIKEVKGDGKRKLVVFTDVDCPFSRKLAQTLQSVDNVTIYTFLFPLVSIHPEAKAKSDAVWCAKDSARSLASVFKGEPIQTMASNPVCDSPVEEIMKLAAEQGIAGTPTIFNGAGDRTAGALPLDKLEEFINAGSTKDKK